MDVAEAMAPGNEEMELNAIHDFCIILTEHQQQCEREGNYVEAEMARKRLQELKTQEEKRRRIELKRRHRGEREELEGSYEAELQRFQDAWNERLEEYDTQATELDRAMRERHEVEIQEMRNKLFGSSAIRKPKFSSQLLNMRKIEQTLAHQKKYHEAHQLKVRADALERWELEKLRAENEQTCLNKEAGFRQKQAQELTALRKRIRAGREELLKTRQSDVDRLTRRFNNLQRELDTHQHLEKNKTKKNPVGRRPAQPRRKMSRTASRRSSVSDAYRASPYSMM
ncbi:Chromosome partition protein Smc [Carpediemonas membranifera]|uniref:Chromosome partition protein Smc n=1 Tax=Carpediemonas membranifera TaxID=201153 RepID=A0A8J6AV84_9EUKA|nr:Chromosome partition protein Smc [Carpediemonas membranifera]|eukprot:KAG9392430.1 Chromosome partition protein Smc [Carpediemonas membranifera]